MEQRLSWGRGLPSLSLNHATGSLHPQGTIPRDTPFSIPHVIYFSSQCKRYLAGTLEFQFSMSSTGRKGGIRQTKKQAHQCQRELGSPCRWCADGQSSRGAREENSSKRCSACSRGLPCLARVHGESRSPGGWHVQGQHPSWKRKCSCSQRASRPRLVLF